MKWNNEQLSAIHTTGTNIVVSASAGAGKTSLLVERLLTLCTRKENPLNLNRIIAMTFTDAAAMEMKKRLSKALNDKLKEDNINKEQVINQLIYLNTAQISTIHSFCLSIIKKYYDVINLNPSMVENNLDEAVVKKIRKEAFLKALYSYKDNQISDLIKFFSNGVFSLNKLENAVLTIIDCANGTFDKDLWYNRVLNSYNPINKINEISKPILTLFYEAIKQDISILNNAYDAFNNSYQLYQNDLKHDETKQLAKIEYYLNNITRSLASLDYDSFRNTVTKLMEIKLLNSRNLPEDYKLSKNKYLHILKETNEKYYADKYYIDAHNSLTGIIKQLIDLAKLTNQEIIKQKRIINGFDFDDMEHFAYDILKANDEMIAKVVKEEYDEILIDEFQDTNEIQNEIINLIAKENNVFRVGDVKQSIYRFRKAKPSIMQKMMNDERYKLISLKNNYRSKENIVLFTNHLFNKIMNVEGFIDSYKEIDKVSIGLDKQKEYRKNTIAFYALINDNDSQYADNELKASFIAHKINDYVLNHHYAYKDFVILVRGHSPKRVLQKAFDNFNVPYFIDAKSGFYNSWMSKIITSYLKLIINPEDEISLMAVLTSPLYEMSDEDAANLVITHQTLYSGIVKTNHPILKDLRRMKEYANISDILNDISLINNFISEHTDIQQRSNFDLYYEKALNFEKQSINLHKFVQQIELSTEESSSEAIVVGTDDDLVRVMTIHQSKGLQFKVVFLWGTTKGSPAFDQVLTDSYLGVSLDNINPEYYVKEKSVHRLAMEYYENIEETQEFIRLLYVALTRAQEEMYIVDTVKKEYQLSPVNLNNAVNSRGKITDILLKTLENNDLFDIHYIKEFNLENISSPLKKEKNVLPSYPITALDKIEIITPSKDAHELDLKLDLNRRADTFTRGTLMHKAIELLPDRLWTDDDINTIDKLSKQDIRHLVKFNQSPIFKRCLNMQIYHEYPFIYKDGSSVINGIIDFMAMNDQEIIIIDFKSDRINFEQKLYESYAKQILFYQDTISKVFPNHHVESYIYSFELDKEIKIGR